MTDIRYGIFLRPDTATCWAITQITLALQQQYGFVAAKAFAPHATLIGNLRTDISEHELLDVLEPVFAEVAPTAVYNSGIDRTAKGTFEYNIDLDSTAREPNRELRRIAAAVKSAVLPLHIPHDDLLAPNVEDYHFAGHLGLASFELAIDNRLSDEVGEFIAQLPISAPASFLAEWYTLFEFTADWTGHWWNDMPWRHVASWRAQP